MYKCLKADFDKLERRINRIVKNNHWEYIATVALMEIILTF